MDISIDDNDRKCLNYFTGLRITEPIAISRYILEGNTLMEIVIRWYFVILFKPKPGTF